MLSQDPIGHKKNTSLTLQTSLGTLVTMMFHGHFFSNKLRFSYGKLIMDVEQFLLSSQFAAGYDVSRTQKRQLYP